MACLYPEEGKGAMEPFTSDDMVGYNSPIDYFQQVKTFNDLLMPFFHIKQNKYARTAPEEEQQGSGARKGKFVGVFINDLLIKI